MTRKANSVNIESPSAAGTAGPARGSYHHGDLRAALVEAGLRLLQSRTADDLSLRELSREVGVSATAIYRHFPDKQSLMAALAHAGLEQLAAEQRTASAAAGSGRSGFLASGLAYVRFAADQPALFRLIFSCAQNEDLLDASIDTVSSAMQGLRRDIERLLPPTLSDAQRKASALHAWALVHGLALLLLDRQIAADWPLIERTLAGAFAPPGAAG